ncbi:RNA polymerase sigma factor [Pontibacter beigongshangensis]|uniref:RNA polymerase sigma factor n=1 Tax=Pontibacter beigongshangensis TaxID=2574733 RepID=UPI0016507934|nr:RNA polymerase sigma factor [Pontibacter beigongshangensis]
MTALEFSNHVQLMAQNMRQAAMRLTQDADDAKDLVQETLLKALLNRDKFSPGTNLKAWLFTIMRNSFINNYNKVTKRSSNSDFDEFLHHLNNDENFTTQNKGTATFVMNDIQSAIEALQEEHRTPFMMYYVGYKYLEIAETLKIPIGTVKNRIFIARQELKAMLKTYQAGA